MSNYENTLLTLPLSKINAHDIAACGGKGASLGELKKAGILVPDGFVITAMAFDNFLKNTQLFEDIEAQIKKINYDDINSVDRYSNVIRDMIRRTKFPNDLKSEILTSFKKLSADYVAVRSSATDEDSKTASFAGELETYLNSTENTLIANVKKCWSSLFTPRAIFYRHEKKLMSSHVSVAVVVQKMIQSQIAGICFTVHPVTQDPNQMIIEAAYGLGEAVVSGSLTPDAYIIDKRNFTLIDATLLPQKKMIVKKSKKGSIHWAKVPKTLYTKQKLSKRQIKELACLCIKIEKHYGFPCDIEWAYSNGKFYITQSRPITTLKNRTNVKNTSPAESVNLLG